MRRPRMTALSWSPWRHRGRVAEAMVLVAAGTVAQRWIPMARWASSLGTPQPVPPSWQGTPPDPIPARAHDEVEYRVATAVARARAHLPHEPTCLVDAFAAQVMLRRRGRAGVVVIGLRRSAVSTNRSWAVHAWLLGREGALTGGAAAEGFTPASVLAVPEGLQPDQVWLGGPTASG